MAGALIGEALLSASIEVLCDRIASREFIGFFRKKKLDESLLMKLETTLVALKAVLNDAEEKQTTNSDVREWLDKLQHAVFDAEDLLDEINTEALRCKVEGEEDQTETLTKVWNWNILSTSRSSVYQRMNVKIQELLQRLEVFVQQKGSLELTEVVGRKVSQRTPTTSLVHEPCVYGRDGDKENLSKLLFDDEASKDDVSVIPIVGMGGVGKTTLARLLYNHDKVEKHFALNAWACVSEDYDAWAIRVTRTLLESVTKKPCNTTDLNLLQVELREQLRGKKFLFVLDDLWKVKSHDWKCFKTPFASGAKGSKIIVTTRNQNVASVMQNVPIQYLKPLSHEDCWSLLAKHAFGHEDHSAHPNLEEIGRQIARKCDGLPLAAETLGGLLRSEIDFEKWNAILTSSIWDLDDDKSDILPALGLSYYHLPPQLKRCFAYCSIFPKDYVFRKEDIIRLWMAEGLIPQVENGKTMEQVAKEYFDELLSRSLFQKLRQPFFTMHDLINDLAMFMSKGFCLRLEEIESKALPERVRHLSYIKGKFDVAPKFEPLSGVKCLRTFMPVSLGPYFGIEIFYISRRVLHDLLPALRSLRVLCLSRYRNVTELPNSVGDLIHLRYLDLSHTKIERLPAVVCTLYNLQTLLLSRCSSLTELPAEMSKLIELRHLDIRGTMIKEMPVQMGRLKKLRTLSDFVVGKSTGSSVGELRDLQNLRGKLSILNLHNVVDATDALRANLKDKKDLTELELAWGDEDADDSHKVKDVLDKLQPSTNLEKLTIRFYGGTNFPNWLGDSSYSNIQVMCLSDCSYCWSLPSVGRLPALKELYIRRMKFVERIGDEFYCGDGASLIQPFRSLEQLEFEEMPEWVEWRQSPSGGQFADFPRLQELILENCPKLRGRLPYNLPCLKELRVSGCGVLHDESATTTSLSVDCLHKSLEELSIDGSPGLLPLTETKFLSVLDIDNFGGLQCLPNINCLQRLTLTNCPSLSSFPEDGLPTTLTDLTIIDCRILEFLSHDMMAKLISLAYLNLDNSCDSMTSFPLGILPKLSTLQIGNCENLESLSTEALDENLNRLTIEDCANLVSFPLGGLPTPNLEQLQIKYCENLKSLPEQIHTLTALQYLKIENLPNLVSFAEGGLPPNLHRMTVSDCDRLRPSVEWGLQGLASLRSFSISGSKDLLKTLLKEQLLPTTLDSLYIRQMYSMISLDTKGLGHLTSLQRLLISGCRNHQFLPGEALGHLTSLRDLTIDSCRNLQFLPGEGLGHLTSLRDLRISGCPNLQFLPGESLPASISHLSIRRCSALEKRYENKTGEDWAKISHIPCIEMNDEVII